MEYPNPLGANLLPSLPAHAPMPAPIPNPYANIKPFPGVNPALGPNPVAAAHAAAAPNTAPAYTAPAANPAAAAASIPGIKPIAKPFGKPSPKAAPAAKPAYGPKNVLHCPPKSTDPIYDPQNVNVEDVYKPVIVQHIHPSHTQINEHYVYEHQHYYPHTVSHSCDEQHHHIQCGCPWYPKPHC